MFVYEPEPIDSPHIYHEGYVGINQYLEYDGARELNGYEWFIEGTENDPDKLENTLVFRSSPTYYENAWEVELISIEVNWITGYPTLEFKISNMHRDYHQYYDGPVSLYSESAVFELETSSYSESHTTPELEMFESDIATFTIPIDVTKNHLSLSWDITSMHPTQDLISDPFTDQGNISIHNIWDSTIDVDLTQDNQVVLNPIKITEEKTYFEKLEFNSLVSISEYPNEITDLYSVEYSNELNENIPQIEYADSIQLNNLDGIEKTGHSQKLENGTMKYDSITHYDHEEEMTMLGNSNDYESSKSLKLPWDYKNNFDTFYSTIYVHSFSDVIYNVELEIGNTNKLRGDSDSKYYFKYLGESDIAETKIFTIEDLNIDYISKEEIKEQIERR